MARVPPLDSPAALPVPAEERRRALMRFGGTLAVVNKVYRAAADKAVGHIGLSQAMAWPLAMIGRHGEGVRPGVLADSLAVEPASLVRQLDQLVEAGLVERREDAVDRRAKTLHLTPAGREAWGRIEAALDTLRAEVFADVPDADLFACLRVFTALHGRLGRGALPLVPSAE